jgi:serine/threonine protein kinase
MTSLATTPTPPDEEAVDPLVGSVLDGRYSVDSLLGEGGLGRVYRGRHLKLGRPVAIKVLLEELREITNVRQRFEREAKTLSALSHPNIVTITDFGVEQREGEEIPYLVMELIDGQELEAVLQREGRLDPERAFDIARQLLKSLAYAHAQGIVHRDLKPGNILLRKLPDGSEHVEVLDFGLAKFFEEEAKSDPGTKLTRVGTIVGTPAYMAPEQVEGSRCDARTDVYATTLVLYEMLTGRMAFEGDEAATLLRHHLVTPPPTLRESMPGAAANEELEALVQRGLAKAPSERFANGSEMLGALEAIALERAFRPSELPPPKRTAPGSTALLTDLRPSLDRVVARIPEPVKDAFGRASKSSLVTRARTLPKWVLAAGGLFGALLIAVVFWWLGSLFEGPPPPPLPMPQADTVLPVLRDKPDARDPFTDEPIPEELAPLHAKLEAGRRLSRREIGTLRAFAADHPDDPRPRLLHAHAYVAKGWLSMALPLYLEAYSLDPSVRGDPRMLDGIVRMARSRALELEGANAVKGIYGDEAEEALEQAIEEARRPDDVARLRALLGEL